MSDHDTAQIRRALSAASPDGPIVDGWSRRRFLQAVGVGAIGGVSLSASEWFTGLAADRAMAAPPVGANDGILVLVTLYGGNDGLNTFVPYGNGTYYDKRPLLAVQPGDVLRLDRDYGMHPKLATLKSLWDRGMVAAVHGVGYEPPDLSHFSSMAIWMSARYGWLGGPTGWLGRWADGLSPAAADLAMVSIGTSVPLQLIGARRSPGPVAVPNDPLLFAPPLGSATRAALAGMVAGTATAPTERGVWGDAIAAAVARTMVVSDTVSPAYRPGEVTGPDLTGKLTVAANLINANLGLRVIDVGRGGFDTHASQIDMHPVLLADLDAGLAAFFARLQPAWRNRVTLLVVSEFGRTPIDNLSFGTDHGTANTVVLIGANVAGGHHGEAPRLGAVDDHGRLASSIDFRAVYGNVLEHWLGAGGGASSVVGGSYAQLGLLRAGPGVAVAETAPQPTLRSAGYVPLSPVRVFDTRDGTGGRDTPVAADEDVRFRLGGRSGVPGEAHAVLLNVTATEATEPTFVTVWDAGTERPTAANCNPFPGTATPALVVGRLGERGEVSFSNGWGEVNLIGDLVGYMDPVSATTFRSLTPRRLLDSRLTGGPFGEGEVRTLRVTGITDVPSDATAVALNIALTQASAPSFLTVWPAGEAMPLAASVNIMPGQTVPNMVVARVGAGGSIAMFNSFGTVEVIVDQLGYFREGEAGGRFVPLTPTRLLDTRIGLGGPQARVTNAGLDLRVSGVGGVPAGATSVMVNVAACFPSRPTFITVYPTGQPRPTAANINVFPGKVAPNMVAVPIGAGGSIHLHNEFGDIDLVADAVGYFSS